MIRGEGGLRDQSAQQLNHARGRNAQQVREVVNMLERIRLEQVHSVEDRKTMAELIEKKIHLYQSERMMIEDARVSRLRQQLASTGVSQEPGRDEEAQPHIETLHTLSDSQITKVCCLYHQLTPLSYENSTTNGCLGLLSHGNSPYPPHVGQYPHLTNYHSGKISHGTVSH